jgi:hypothetical protein
MKKINIPLLISFILSTFLLSVFFLSSCTARKVETKKDTEKTQGIETVKAESFDYLKLMENNFSFDKGIIFVKEYQNGIVVKETLEQKNQVKTQYKTEIKTSYKNFNIYKKYKINKTTLIKNTQKEGVSIWVWIIGFIFIFVFSLIKFPKKVA